MVEFFKYCAILMVGFVLSFVIAIFLENNGGWWIGSRPSILVSFSVFIVRPLIGYDVSLAEDVADFLTFLIPVLLGVAFIFFGVVIFLRSKLRRKFGVTH